jgi:putative DNA primase/helicase
MILSNLLPKFNDASGAIISRLVVLQTTISFLGREDREIETRVLKEMTGVLNWALEGARRLFGKQKGVFTEQPAAAAAIRTMLDMAAPVSAYVRENAVLDLNAHVATDTMFSDFDDWREQQGIPKIDAAQFGRDLVAAFPQVVRFRPSTGKKRAYAYKGIRLRTEKDAESDEPELTGL